MRFVDLKKIKIPEEWLKKAEKLQAELELLDTLEKKMSHIDKNEIWQDKAIFKVLSEIMDGKCWYSEAKELMSDRDVDHFRPKKKAKNADQTERDGYWFLAYDWENYRFSSIYSNRLRKDKNSEENTAYGKGTYFPLKTGNMPAISKAKIADERPFLIDPTVKSEAALISFNVFGKVVPSVPKKFSWEVSRVTMSVDFYHLNHGPLKEARKKKWQACQRNIDKITELCSLPNRTLKDDSMIQFLSDQLIEWADEKELLSGVTIACLSKNNLLNLLAV